MQNPDIIRKPETLGVEVEPLVPVPTSSGDSPLTITGIADSEGGDNTLNANETTMEGSHAVLWQVPMNGIAVRTVDLMPRDEQRTAQMGRIVCCNYMIWLLSPSSGSDDLISENRTITSISPIEVQTNKLFTIGEGDTVAALELALRHSQQGDVLYLRAASKFAYSAAGRPGTGTSAGTSEGTVEGTESPVATSSQQRTFDLIEAQTKLDTFSAKSPTLVGIPPGADLEYLVHVTGVYDDPLQALRAANPDYDARCRDKEEAIAAEGQGGIEHVLAEVQIRKLAGNGWFACGDFARAGKCYGKAVQIADAYQADDMTEESNGEPSSNDSRLEELSALLLTALNNLAACHVSRGEYAMAKELCVRVLEVDPSNSKGLLRAARASLALHEYDESELCLRRAMEVHTELSASDPDADPMKVASFYAIELSKVEKARREYKAREKAMATKMASRLFGGNKASPAPSAAAAAGAKKPADATDIRAASTGTTPSQSEAPSSSSPPNRQPTDDAKVEQVAAAAGDDAGEESPASDDTEGGEEGGEVGEEGEGEVGWKNPLKNGYVLPILLLCNAAVLLLSIVLAFYFPVE